MCADLGGQPAHGSSLSRDGCKRGHSRRGLVGAGAVVFGSREGRAGGSPSSASMLAHEDRAWLLLGRALVAQDSLAAARAVLEEGLARVASGPAQAVEFHFELGSVALGEREYEAAERAFSAVLERPRVGGCRRRPCSTRGTACRRGANGRPRRRPLRSWSPPIPISRKHRRPNC